jgi:hypothetical protein
VIEVKIVIKKFASSRRSVKDDRVSVSWLRATIMFCGKTFIPSQSAEAAIYAHSAAWNDQGARLPGEDAFAPVTTHIVQGKAASCAARGPSRERPCELSELKV